MTFRLSDEEARRFDALASQHGGRSALLRQMVASVSEQGGVGPGAGTERDSGDYGRATAKEKVTVRLKPEDMDRLDAEAKGTGLRRTQWLVALIRRRLYGRPQFNHADRMDLRQIVSELRRIGVNLNQMAKALNKAVLPGTTLDNQIETIQRYEAETRRIGTALRASIAGQAEYWDAPNG